MIVDVLTCCLSPLFPFSLYLTVRLCVCSLTVKPTILEADLASVNVQPFMFGKQHQLPCVAKGLPLPNITWLWQPCSDPTLAE